MLLSVVAVVAAGVLLPFIPLATLLGFTALPPTYLIFLVGVAGKYLLSVVLAKRQLLGRLMAKWDWTERRGECRTIISSKAGG